MATITEQTPAPPVELLSWRAHPARERPAAALLGGLAVIAVALLCAALGGVFWGILAVVVLLLSLNRFFFPSRFAIDSEGVTASYLLGTQRCRWSETRRLSCDRHGLYLSRRSRRSRLDAYRGVHLLFGRWREEVLRTVRSSLAAGGEAT